jgi:hypothetical protein
MMNGQRVVFCCAVARETKSGECVCDAFFRVCARTPVSLRVVGDGRNLAGLTKIKFKNNTIHT